MESKNTAGPGLGFRPREWRVSKLADELLRENTPEQLAEIAAERSIHADELQRRIDALEARYAEKDGEHQAQTKRFRRVNEMLAISIEQTREPRNRYTPKTSRTDNLKRAIFDAWNEGYPLDAATSELFDYLARKDNSGFIRGRNGNELTWENSSGELSRTSMKAFSNRLPEYRKQYKSRP